MDKSKKESLVKAGQMAVKIYQLIIPMIKPGLNLLELNKFIETEIDNNGMSASFKGFHKYPAATCLAVNDEVVHAIPTDYNLQKGDILSVDFGVTNNGWIIDTARTYAIGNVEPYIEKLLTVDEEALNRALSVARAGNTIGDIGYAIESYVTEQGFYIVKDLCGHGVGRTLQEEPQIPNYGKPHQGKVLQEGMVLAIEPIISVKKCSISILDDDWTIVSNNRTESSQFEDTIIVTKDRPIILTR